MNCTFPHEPHITFQDTFSPECENRLSFFIKSCMIGEHYHIGSEVFLYPHEFFTVHTLYHIISINPEIKRGLKLEREGWHGQPLAGYVFLCVDNIDLRREIATANKDNMNIKAMFDFRMRLTDAQSYAADWQDMKMIEAFLNSMNFTQEEGKAETPVSACNLELSFASTVFMIVSAGVQNFVNFVKNGVIKKFIVADVADFGIIAL